MSLRFTSTPSLTTLALSGDIDHHSARSLMLSAERELLARDPKALSVDMAEVSFMDSSGIALMLRLWRRCEELGVSMAVKNIPPQAKKVFSAAGLSRLIPMC